ncbi:hypothetical protein [Thiomicrorhabdus sp.]|uniref:hypothetical protein n=1 Tax=Thiomicrorhabdus sp. TaxID=2039724 RepID=UPI0029C6519A|nr:hypothetical protein [Thiomicrorhabdus sp.]
MAEKEHQSLHAPELKNLRDNKLEHPSLRALTQKNRLAGFIKQHLCRIKMKRLIKSIKKSNC